MTEYGWPPRMLMRIACAYTGRSRWALARAVREGTLQAAGKNGRSLVFDRAALDVWMVAGAACDQSVQSTPPTPARAAPRSSTDALARLRALTAGTR